MTRAVAKRPVRTPPATPPAPWTPKASRASSKPKRCLSCRAAAAQAMELQAPLQLAVLRPKRCLSCREGDRSYRTASTSIAFRVRAALVAVSVLTVAVLQLLRGARAAGGGAARCRGKDFMQRVADCLAVLELPGGGPAAMGEGRAALVGLHSARRRLVVLTEHIHTSPHRVA